MATLYTFDWELFERYHPCQLGAKLGFKLSRDDTRLEAAEAARWLEAALTANELDHGALHGLLAQAVEAINHLDERPIISAGSRTGGPFMGHHLEGGQVHSTHLASFFCAGA